MGHRLHDLDLTFITADTTRANHPFNPHCDHTSDPHLAIFES